MARVADKSTAQIAHELSCELGAARAVVRMTGLMLVDQNPRCQVPEYFTTRAEQHITLEQKAAAS